MSLCSQILNLLNSKAPPQPEGVRWRLFDRCFWEAAAISLGFCGKLRPFRVTFSYIFLYATFPEKEPVKKSSPVEGCFSALPCAWFLITDLLMSPDPVSPIFFYYFLIRDFIRKRIRKGKKFSNLSFSLYPMVFIEGCIGGNVATSEPEKAKHNISCFENKIAKQKHNISCFHHWHICSIMV